MAGLGVTNLYEKASDKRIDSFNRSLTSKMSINKNFEKVDCDIEWLEMMENTIRYLDNILRNPNRFIVNEEEIVKIEQARRVTVESIKHLSKNTNLIQKIEDNGDVKPSKILNINKEESFNTYENRFIYTLINNMKMYTERKKKSLGDVTGSSLKCIKKMEYEGVSQTTGEDITIAIQLESKLNKKDTHHDDGNHNLIERIERLEGQITALQGADVYNNLKKLRVAMVTSPIKKTNVILKNTNFQYALKMWDYMQAHMEETTQRTKNNEKIEDELLKSYIDDTFLLDYLVVSEIDNEKRDEEVTKELSKRLLDNVILKLVELNPEATESEIKDLIGEQYAVAKYKTQVSDDDIKKTFKKAINNYLDKIEENKL